MEISYLFHLLVVIGVIVLLNILASLDMLVMAMWSKPLIPFHYHSLRVVIGFSSIMMIVLIVLIILQCSYIL